MATGVIAVGAHSEGLDWLDDGLFVVDALAYLVIAVLTALRTARYPRPVLADMTSHARGFAFLTAVAAANVLGIAAGIIQGWWGFVWALWFVGIALCVVLLYITLIAVVLRSPKPGLEAPPHDRHRGVAARDQAGTSAVRAGRWQQPAS